MDYSQFLATQPANMDTEWRVLTVNICGRVFFIFVHAFSKPIEILSTVKLWDAHIYSHKRKQLGCRERENRVALCKVTTVSSNNLWFTYNKPIHAAVTIT